MTHHTAAPLPKKETVPPLTPLRPRTEKLALRCIFKWNICPSVLFSPIFLLHATPPLLLRGHSACPRYFPSLYKEKKKKGKSEITFSWIPLRLRQPAVLANMWWLVFLTGARIVVLKKDICGRRWVLIQSTGDQGGAGMLQHVLLLNIHPNYCYSTALRTIRVHVSNKRMRLERLRYYFIKGQIWKNVGANWKMTGTSSFIPSLVDIRRK